MRAPYQILAILYKRENNKILYGIFYRNSHPIWQFISGGGENNENPLETVIREIEEETSLSVEKEKIEQLDSKTTIPVLNITGEYTWGKNVYVVPEYSFAIEIKDEDGNIQLSNEHKEYKWVEYEEALKKLKYDSNKTALWELNEKINKKEKKMQKIKTKRESLDTVRERERATLYKNK